MDIFGNKRKQLELQEQEAEAERMALAIATHKLSLNFNECSDPILELFTSWQRNVRDGNIEEAAQIYDRFQSWLSNLDERNYPKLESDLHIDIKTATEEFAAAIQLRYQELCAAAEESAAGFEKLRDFIDAMRRPYYRALKVTCPANWNDLVATYIQQPTVDDFVGLPKYWTNEAYWLSIAGIAKADSDVKTAKRVIAMHNHIRGDVSQALAILVSDLVTMVARKRPRA